MTAKQEMFVNAYLKTQNASESARIAGYSARTAHRSGQENMQRHAIKKAIEEGLKSISADLEITPENIKKTWWDIFNNTKNVSDQLRASELLAKTLGMLKDTTIGPTIIFADSDSKAARSFFGKRHSRAAANIEKEDKATKPIPHLV